MKVGRDGWLRCGFDGSNGHSSGGKQGGTEQRLVVVRAAVDLVGAEQRLEIARNVCGMPSLGVLLDRPEDGIEERGMGRAVAEVEHQPLEPVREQAHPPRRPIEGGKPQGLERVGLGQEMRGVGVLAVIRPVHRVPALLAVIDHNGAIADLADNAAVDGQDGYQQGAGIIVDHAAGMSGLQLQGQPGLADGIAQNVCYLVRGRCPP